MPAGVRDPTFIRIGNNGPEIVSEYQSRVGFPECPLGQRDWSQDRMQVGWAGSRPRILRRIRCLLRRQDLAYAGQASRSPNRSVGSRPRERAWNLASRELLNRGRLWRCAPYVLTYRSERQPPLIPLHLAQRPRPPPRGAHPHLLRLIPERLPSVPRVGRTSRESASEISERCRVIGGDVGC